MELVVLVALAASFMVLLVKKWGIAEWMQIHGGEVMSRLFSCDFCMSFWSSLVVCVLISCWHEDPVLLAVPLFSTPIARMMV